MAGEMRPRLHRLLVHARENVPYYAEFPLPNSELETVERTLRKIPILDRADVRRAGRRLHSLSESSDEWMATSTSGTTGEPLTVLFDTPPQALEVRLIMRFVERLQITESSGILHVTLHTPGPSQAMHSPWGDGTVLTRWNLDRVWQLDDRSFADRLEEAFAGRILTAMPSVLGLLADRLGDRGTGAPAGVLMSGETSTPELRRKIEKRFHCPVSSLYTMAEVGIVGTECTKVKDSYHLEEECCHVEILDNGDLLVTPLTNLAMPLIRYRTGDKARWAGGLCGCGRDEPAFELTSARSPGHLVTASGEAVSISSFIKHLISLPVDRISIAQEGPGHIRIDYQAAEPLNERDQERATTPLRSSLGLETKVSFHRHKGPAFPQPTGRPIRPETTVVPLGPAPEDISSWLESWFAERGLIPRAAILTGTVLNPSTRTRFSDIDLTLFVGSAPDAWTEIVRLMRQHLPSLRTTVVSDLDQADHSPMAVCRLICEGRLILGSPPDLTWPDRRAIAAEGIHWCRTAADTLWHHLTDPTHTASDTLSTACLAQKIIVNACRYRHLIFEARETRAEAVLSAELDPDENLAIEVIEVAREHRPPPPDQESSRRYLTAARTIAIEIADELANVLTEADDGQSAM